MVKTSPKILAYDEESHHHHYHRYHIVNSGRDFKLQFDDFFVRLFRSDNTFAIDWAFTVR